MSIVVKTGRRVTSVSRVPTGPRRRARRNRPARSRSMFTPSLAIGRDYAKTLYDPWEFPPIKLGFGTMVNTFTSTAYLRSFFTVNSDGSFSVFMMPVSGASFLYANNAAYTAAPVYTANASVNNAAIMANSSSARVVSGGLRLFVLFPQTSAPGVLGAGTFAATSASQMTALKSSDLMNSADTELGIGTHGARAVTLPQDVDSYGFYNQIIQTGGFSGTSLSSVPYIVGNGFPAGSTVWVEAVLNLECLPSNAQTSIGLNLDEPPVTAASSWSNVETLYSYARSLFTSPVVMDGAAFAAGLASPAAGRVMSAVRDMSRRSPHIQGAVIGGNSVRAARQGTLIIEEMKDNFA